MPRKKQSDPQICKACVYFHDHGKETRAATMAQIGECRRYPPKVIRDDEDNYIYFWPSIPETEWCGEFRRRCDA
jgi:hypothetical protein